MSPRSITDEDETMNKLINKITTGNARELIKRIPDESIDLIFTDPVYDRLEDYEWLAIEAKRILKPDRACLVWCSVQQMDKAKSAMTKHLDFIWWICYVKFGGATRLIAYNIFTKWTPLLWINKGNYTPTKRILDAKVCHRGSTKYPDTANYKWAKHPDFLIEYTSAFSNADEIVFDPFCGGGTIPAVCKMLGRDFIAFEIDPETAELARERVLNTQPPLFVLEPEQLEFNN